MSRNKETLSRTGLISGGLIFLATAVMLLFVDPIPQWPEYHQFADTRTMFGIPNAHNVLSNAPFLVVGLWGIRQILFKPWVRAAGLRIPYLVFFLGILLTSLGSSWYHLHPDNVSLVWDRLPMAVTAMAFLTIATLEFLEIESPHRLIWPGLLAGIGSVLWWAWTESQGAGDLRPYALVQFLPALLVVFMMLTVRAPVEFIVAVVGMIAFYAMAKLCEHFDTALYDAFGGISGHALKHVFAAVAAASLLYPLSKPNSES